MLATGAEKVITGGIRQPQKHVIIDLGDKDQFMVDKEIAGLTDADPAGHNNVGEGYGIDIATFKYMYPQLSRHHEKWWKRGPDEKLNAPFVNIREITFNDISIPFSAGSVNTNIYTSDSNDNDLLEAVLHKSDDIMYAENLNSNTIKYKVLRYIGHCNTDDYYTQCNDTNHYHKDGWENWWDNPPAGWHNHNPRGIPNWEYTEMTASQIIDKIDQYKDTAYTDKFKHQFWRNPQRSSYNEMRHALPAFSDFKKNNNYDTYIQKENKILENILMEDDFGNSGMNVYVRKKS